MIPLDFRKVGPGTCLNELRKDNLLAVPNLVEKIHSAADEIEQLRAELAAAQADNKRLRDALKVATSICWSNFSDSQEIVLTEALATTSQDDALREYGAKLVEKYRCPVCNTDLKHEHASDCIADKIRK